MRKSVILLLLLTFSPALYSQSTLKQKTDHSNDGWWYISDTIKLSNFIGLLKINDPKDSLNPLVEIDDNFPNHFVKQSDIETLIKSIKSIEKCKCTFNPLSSYIPLRTDSAELGGYIISLIKSYKNKTKFSVWLYFCPKMDGKEADYLIDWWSKNKKH
jgi:hypothetical protein